MNIISILLIAFALACDSFAVAITYGMINKIFFKDYIIISFIFGSFQGGMAYLGWISCYHFRYIIEPFDHWIAFLLLSFIGLNMIFHNDEYVEQKDAPITLYSLLIVSIATSIDAFATGASFSVLYLPILFPSAVIGIITFILSFIGIFIGKKIQNLFFNYKKLYTLSGLILLSIAFKVLLKYFSYY